MNKRSTKEIEETKRLMGALVRMKPKPHEEMKVGRGAKSELRGSRSPKPRKSPQKS